MDFERLVNLARLNLWQPTEDTTAQLEEALAQALTWGLETTRAAVTAHLTARRLDVALFFQIFEDTLLLPGDRRRKNAACDLGSDDVECYEVTLRDDPVLTWKATNGYFGTPRDYTDCLEHARTFDLPRAVLVGSSLVPLGRHYNALARHLKALDLRVLLELSAEGESEVPPTPPRPPKHYAKTKGAVGVRQLPGQH